MPDTDPELIDPAGLDVGVLLVIQSAPLSGLNELPRCRQTASSIRQLLKDNCLSGTEVEAGLWLLAGELELSHQVSQSLPTSEGSYWHAIMHRREGDFWNSKYWYRKVHSHPVFQRLAAQIDQNARRLREFTDSGLDLDGLSDPKRVSEELVDLVEQSLAKRREWQIPLQMICWWEWQLLFQHCYTR